MMKLSIEHQARQLLHGIEMLTRCLRIPGTDAARRAEWEAQIRNARVDLEAFYVDGLDRDFRSPPEVKRWW
jgi:hypothetical protein